MSRISIGQAFRSVVVLMLSCLFICGCEQSTDNANIQGSGDENITVDSILKPVVGAEVKTVDVYEGDTFTVDIKQDNFPISEGGGIDISFNADLLRVVDVEVSHLWDFSSKEGIVDNNAGVVSGVLFSSYKGVEGDAVLAKVAFQALSRGEAEITLSESSLNPFASEGSEINPEFISTHVVIR